MLLSQILILSIKTSYIIFITYRFVKFNNAVPEGQRGNDVPLPFTQASALQREHGKHLPGVDTSGKNGKTPGLITVPFSQLVKAAAGC